MNLFQILPLETKNKLTQLTSMTDFGKVRKHTVDLHR